MDHSERPRARGGAALRCLLVSVALLLFCATACDRADDRGDRIRLPSEQPTPTSVAPEGSPSASEVSPSPDGVHITSAPRKEKPLSPGLHPITAGGQEGRIYVGSGVQPSVPAPLIIFLHGAGGGFGRGISLFNDHAERRDAILVDPVGGLGVWEPVISDVLDFVFARYSVDRSHILLVGFSDGASSSLSVGLANGDVFSHVAAMSPGFMSVEEYRGTPRVFISHGRQDPVLSFQNTSEDIVPELVDRGYDVTFLPFEGKHESPQWVADRIVKWFFSTAA